MDQAIVANAVSTDSPLRVSPQVFARMCVFTLGAGQYAVDLRQTREVVPVESITTVPGMPRVLIGVTNVRGTVVPVLDLRFLLRLPPAESSAPFVVVLRHEQYYMGVQVERTPEIMSALPEEILPAPKNGHDGRGAPFAFVVGALKTNDRLISILDVSRLVEQVESEQLAKESE